MSAEIKSCVAYLGRVCDAQKKAKYRLLSPAAVRKWAEGERARLAAAETARRAEIEAGHQARLEARRLVRERIAREGTARAKRLAAVEDRAEHRRETDKEVQSLLDAGMSPAEISRAFGKEERWARYLVESGRVRYTARIPDPRRINTEALSATPAAAVAAMIRNGERTKALAARFGVCRPVILDYVKRHHLMPLLQNANDRAARKA